MVTNLSAQIVDKFSKNFLAAYRCLTGGNKSIINKYSPVIFKRWYYSAIVAETTISPSFLYNKSINESSFVCAPAVFPTVSGDQLKGFTFRENKYSIKNHPIVSDLNVLLDFCLPDIELDENGLLTEGDATKISGFLSIGDPFYVDFLAELSFFMKLLKKTDAIYSNKASVTPNYSLFSELNQGEALKKIVDAAIKLCSKNISGILPENLQFVSESGIIRLIKKPLPIDEIFKRVFGSFGINIEEVWDNFNQGAIPLDESQNEVLSSAFLFGSVLDKWFITPFSEYLKIIEPIYCFNYNFQNELEYLLEVINNGGDISSALFSPAAYYSFTSLGKIFFMSDTGVSVRKKSASVSVEELVELLNFDMDSIIKSSAQAEAPKIILFEVTEDKTRAVKHIEASELNTLHELHMEIAANYDLDFNNYAFFLDDSKSPFLTYKSPKSRGKALKADKAFIEDLCFKEGQLLTYQNKEGEYIIQVLENSLNAEEGAPYPRSIKK